MSSSLTLFGIDPGVNNGFAVRLSNGKRATATYRNIEDIWVWLRDAKPQAVAVEAFHTGNRVDEAIIHTIEVVGSIRGICYVLGIPCLGQMPQARKSFVPDALEEFMKIHGRKAVMTKAADDHEIAALSHLLCLEYRINSGEVKLP